LQKQIHFENELVQQTEDLEADAKRTKAEVERELSQQRKDAQTEASREKEALEAELAEKRRGVEMNDRIRVKTQIVDYPKRRKTWSTNYHNYSKIGSGKSPDEPRKWTVSSHRSYGDAAN
jgi:hypothetical protein